MSVVKRIERLEKRLTPKPVTPQPAETEADVAHLCEWVGNRLATGGFDARLWADRLMLELLDLARARRIAAEGKGESPQ